MSSSTRKREYKFIKSQLSALSHTQTHTFQENRRVWKSLFGISQEKIILKKEEEPHESICKCLCARARDHKLTGPAATLVRSQLNLFFSSFPSYSAVSSHFFFILFFCPFLLIQCRVGATAHLHTQAISQPFYEVKRCLKYKTIFAVRWDIHIPLDRQWRLWWACYFAAYFQKELQLFASVDWEKSDYTTIQK